MPRRNAASPGSPTLWDYSQNFPQFSALVVGAPVEVVIGPKDQGRRYTAVDVQTRTNEGVGLFFGFCVLMGLAGLAAVPLFLRFSRTLLEIARERERARR